MHSKDNVLPGVFKMRTDMTPKGDQPEAIERLVRGIERGDRGQTLLGVTGSGKTFTMASVIERTQRPALIIAHNKTLAGQLTAEFMNFPMKKWNLNIDIPDCPIRNTLFLKQR